MADNNNNDKLVKLSTSLSTNLYLPERIKYIKYIKHIKYKEYIDITFDIYCTGGYLTDIISDEEYSKIHIDLTKSEQNIFFYKTLSSSINPNRIITITSILPDIFSKNPIVSQMESLNIVELLGSSIQSIKNQKPNKNDNKMLCLTIDHFIKHISNSNLDELRFILESDKNNNYYINLSDKDNDTLLHFSVFANNYDITKLFLKYGANPNKCDNDGQSPIFRSVFCDN